MESVCYVVCGVGKRVNIEKQHKNECKVLLGVYKEKSLGIIIFVVTHYLSF